MSQSLLPTLQVSLIANTGWSQIDSITNDPRLKVDGLVEGARVQYSQNGVDWSESAPEAVQGLNSVYVRQIDDAGNLSAKSVFRFTFDSQAADANLQLALLNDTGVVGDLISRNGLVQPLNVAASHYVEFSADGVVWSKKQPAAIEGMNTLWMRQVDAAGNASIGQQFTFVIDTQAAAAPVVALAHDTGGSAADRLTADASLQITGLEAGAKVQYSQNGKDWSESAPVAVDGANVLYVRQVDVAGNASLAQRLSFVVDTQAPAAPVLALLNDTGESATDGITFDGRLQVTGLEAGASLQYSINGNDWTASAPVAVEGINTVYARQTDAAGNVSAVSALSFTLLPTPAPDADLQLALRSDSGLAGDLISRDGVVLVSNVGAGNRLEYSSNGTDWSTTQPAAVEGANTVWVRQINTFGKASSGQSFSFSLDTVAAAPIAMLANDTGVSATDRLTTDARLQVTGLEAGAKLQYSQNGTDWSESAPEAVQGLNSVYVRQIDVAGNISAKSVFRFTLDSQAADANLQLALLNDTGVVGDLISRNGVAQPLNVAASHYVEYSADGVVWSKKQPAAVEGLNTLWMRQVDQAGNASTGQQFTFVIDTQAAAAPVVTLANDTGGSATDRLTADTSLQVAGLEAGAKVQYSQNGKDWSDTPPVAGEGANTVYVRQMDVAGNASSAQSIHYLRDTTVNPLVWRLAEDTGVSTTDAITRNAAVQVSGLEAGGRWAYQIDGTGAWIDGVGTTFNTINGEHSYVLRHTDNAGNTAYTAAFTVNAILEPSAISVQVLDSQGQVVSNGFTNDPNAVLRLSGDATDIWQYRYVGDANWQDVTGGTVDLPLANGAHDIETRKIDIAGNQVSTITRVKLDNSAAVPTMTLAEDTGVAGDGLTTNPLVNIGGLEAFAKWEVRVDDSPYWNEWSLNPNQFKLLVGTHTYQIRQTDKAGNVSAIGEYTFTYQSAVEQPTLSLDNDTGVNAFDLVTNQRKINVNGLLPDAVWQYQIDDNGQWLNGTGASFDMLTDGQGHSYTVRQQSGGQWSEPTTLYQVRFDNSAPSNFAVALAVDSGSSGTDGITNQNTINLSGLEIGARLEYRVDGGAWQGFEINSANAVLSLDVGTHAYEFRQQDIAGNTSSSISRTYTYINADLAAPTLTLAQDSGLLGNDNVTADGQINVGLSVAGSGVSWQYAVDGSNVWQNGSGASFTALNGQHSYRVRQIDVAGNISPVSAVLTVNRDADAPVFSSNPAVRIADVDSERVQTISTQQVLYTVQATDATAVRYSMADSDIFNFDPATRQLTFKQPIGYQLNGANSYSTVITATDLAGNQSAQTVTITVDRTNTATPEIQFSELYNGAMTYANPASARIILDNGQLVSVLQQSPTNSSTKLVRYNTDGSIDTTFNSSALSGVNIPHLVKDAQGNFIYIADQSSQITVQKFDSNGAPITSWGPSGSKTMATAASGITYDAKVLADGTILAVGYQNNATSGLNDTRIIKISPAGVLSTFAFDAKPAGYASAGYTNIWNVAVDGTGQYAYVLYNSFRPSSQSFVKKFNLTTNSYDTSFGSSGSLEVTYTEVHRFIGVDSLGRLLVVTDGAAGSNTIKITRYLATGAVDNTFGSNGVVTLSDATNKIMNAVDIADDNSVYLIYQSNANNAVTKVAHVKANGLLDTAFSGDGIVELSGLDAPALFMGAARYSLNYANGMVNVVGPTTDDSGHLASKMYQINNQGVPSTQFGYAQLTFTEGNRPIGLLNTKGSVIDGDAADTNYNGVSLTIERNGGAKTEDVFGTRGKLSFDAGQIVWDGVTVGSVTNTGGKLTLTFNSSAVHSVVDGVVHSLTYSNSNPNLSPNVYLKWTLNDNDPMGAKVSSKLQSISMADDHRDAGDFTINVSNNGAALTLSNYVTVNGKYYYVADLSASNYTLLDQFFNNGADTTVNARTVTQSNGMAFKLLTTTEIDALLSNAALSSWKSEIFKALPNNQSYVQGLWAADLGSGANQHLFKQYSSATSYTSVADAPGATTARARYALVEVTPATESQTVIVQPQVQLAEDNGDSATDFLTSNGRLNILGLDSSSGYRYSLNSGQTWVTLPVGSPFYIQLAEGTYLKDSIIVEQTDLSGFTTQISNNNSYKIDKTIKSVSLYNDQGLSTTDFITADGRVVLTGIAADTPYQYSTNGGSSWQTGGMLDASTYGFTLASGTYAANAVVIRQTDVNNFTSYARNNIAYTVSPTQQQGSISLNLDTGSSNTDRLTAESKFTVTGLDASQPWQYSTNSGSTWLTGSMVGGKNIFELAEGSYAVGQIRVRQVDSKGFTVNFQTSETYQIDKTVATAAITLVNDSGYSNTDLLTADGRIAVSMTGTLNAGDTWQYSLDAGKTWTQGSGSSQTITLANGVYNAQQIRVQVTDQAGNSSSASFDKRVVVDNTDTSAPVFSSSASVYLIDRDGTATARTLSAATPVLTVQTTDANTVYYSLGGASASLFNINQSTGQISFKANTNLNNAQGDDYSLTVNAADAFNNISTQNVTIKVRDILRVTSKSVSDKYTVIDNVQDLVLTFNQDIAFDPSGTISLYEPYAGARTLDINDPNQVKIVGNQLIIQTDGLQSQGAYTVTVAGGIKSVETGEKWSAGWYDGLGFSLNKQVIYDNGQLTPRDSFEALSIDGSGHKGSVAIVGDVNGDGIDDWAVSYATGDSLGRSDNGKVYVVYGRTDNAVPNLANVANGVGGYLISGRYSGDQAGSSIAAAGDVNGDGLQDLLIHAKGANGGMGKGYIVYGSRSAGNLDLTTVENNSAYGRVFTNNVSDSFGAVGDVNGDGYDDIGHGRGDLKLTTTWDEVKTSKRVYTTEGKIIVKADWFNFVADWIDAATTIADLLDDPLAAGTELLFEQLEDEMEEDGSKSQVEQAMLDQLRSVTNQLGSSQKLIGYSYTESGGSSGGLFSIPKDTVYTIKYTIEATDKTTTRWTQTLNGAGQADIELGGAYGSSGTKSIIGNINGEQLGAQMVALGDINGDGRADYGVLDTGSGGVMARLNVVLGSRNSSNIFTSNLDAQQEGFRIIDPNQSTEYVGNGNVTGLGDVNGDGLSDFAITIDSAKAATYVVYGRAGMNSVNLAQVAAGNGGFVLSAAGRGSNVHVDAIGDFNGDGLDDLVYYSSSSTAGYAYTLSVVYGSKTPVAPFYGADFTNGIKGFRVETGWGANDGFADTNAVSAGDINGDGLSDLVIRGKNGDSLFVMGSTDNGKYSQVQADQVGTTGNDVITSAGAQLIVGGAGNDTITTNGADVILAGAGNDRIVVGSTMATALESVLGAGGNIDQLAKINGGAGMDTLQLSGGISLDFSKISNKMLGLDNISGRVDNIEVLDMATDSLANTLKLTLSDVLDMAGNNIFNTNTGWSNVIGGAVSGQVNQHQLSLTGNSNDTLQLRGSEWSNSGAVVRDSGGELYKVYTAQNSAAQLMIDKDILIAVI